MEATNSIIQQTSDKEIDLSLQNSPRPPYSHALVLKNKKGSKVWKQILQQTDKGSKRISKREEKWSDQLAGPLQEDFWKTQYLMTQKLAFDNRLMFNHLLFLKHNLKLNYQVSTFRRDIQPQCTLC